MSSDELGASFIYDTSSDLKTIKVSRNNSYLEILNPKIGKILNLSFENFNENNTKKTK